MTKPGILALWKDCAPGQEALFEHWYRSEHLAERVGVPGFRRGRRYEAIEAKRGYFTYYETDRPEVLVSDAYLQRLDNPSPLTREIMSGVMKAMNRTICRVEWSIGGPRGGQALTTFLARDGAPATRAAGEALAALPGVVRVELWQAANELAAPVSEEEKRRGGDDKIDVCLFVETLREADLRACVLEIDKRLGPHVKEVGRYRLLCDLQR